MGALIQGLSSVIEGKGLKRVKSVVVYVGELQSLDLEFVRDSIIKYLQELQVSFDDVRVVEEKALFECGRCGFSWDLSVGVEGNVRELMHFLPEAVFSFIKCPRCGSRDYSVKSGRVLRIKVEV